MESIVKAKQKDTGQITALKCSLVFTIFEIYPFFIFLCWNFCPCLKRTQNPISTNEVKVPFTLKGEGNRIAKKDV